MVKKLNSVIETEIIESDDGLHRYSLKRNWNEEQPSVTVLTLYPTTNTGPIDSDLTSQLILNNLYHLGYGRYYSVNLFSEKLEKKYNYGYAVDDINDTCIINAVKDSEIIIMAYGSAVKKNKKISNRLDEVLKLLKKHRQTKKIRTLTNGESSDSVHPLAPAVRKRWNVI